MSSKKHNTLITASDPPNEDFLQDLVLVLRFISDLFACSVFSASVQVLKCTKWNRFCSPKK